MKKIKDRTYHNFLKNGYLFWYYFSALSPIPNKEFTLSIAKLWKKWKSPNKALGFFWECENYKEIKEKNNIAYRQRVDFLKSLTQKEKFELLRDINGFIEKFDFGDEWFQTITDYVISLWLSPPIYNLSIERKKNRVVLILNPDTSIDDIREAYWWIKKKQIEFHPGFKRRPNFSTKTFKNLFIALQDRLENLKEKKEFDSVECKEYKITDLDLASKFFNNRGLIISTQKDEKNMLNLRQIRSRYKKKKA